jgi:galactose mutarotase-like enzyme
MPAKKSAVRRGPRGAARVSFSTKVAGWKSLVLESDRLRVTTLPEYGGWIVSILYRPRDVEMLYRTPRGLISRDDLPVVTDPLGGFRAYSPGGWPELFPHGSAATEIAGVRMPFHGEAVSRAWHCEVLKAPRGEAAARLWVDCHLLPLRLERVMRVRAGSATLTLEETVTNRSGLPIDFMWGHHPYYGRPVLDAGSRIFAPAAKSLTTDYQPAGWPLHNGADLSLCPAERAGTGEMFYLTDLAEGWYALVNGRERLGLAMSWDKDVFPFVWIWREANKNVNYPYFGDAYTVAIEPFSSLPGARERGERLLKLPGGGRLATRLCFTAFDGLGEVTGVSPDGRVTGD